MFFSRQRSHTYVFSSPQEEVVQILAKTSCNVSLTWGPTFSPCRMDKVFNILSGQVLVEPMVQNNRDLTVKSWSKTRKPCSLFTCTEIYILPRTTVSNKLHPYYIKVNDLSYVDTWLLTNHIVTFGINIFLCPCF